MLLVIMIDSIPDNVKPSGIGMAKPVRIQERGVGAGIKSAGAGRPGKP